MTGERSINTAIKNRAGMLTLEISGGGHAAGGANRDDRPMRITTTELQQRRAEIADARHAIRMSERDRAAVDVRNRPRRVELALVVQRRHRKRFVQLP